MFLDFSVLMSVYAKEKPDFLNQSLESIWDAQRLKPTQIDLVKNGLLPKGLEDIVSSWSNKLGGVLKIVNLELNAGLAPALNHGLMHCDYDYVARMDSDDISLPDRFYLQTQFIIKNPDVDCFGSWVAEYDESLTKLIKYRKVPLKHSEIVKFCRRRNPLSHPSVFFRKEAVLAVGCYDEFSPEDYFLWFKLLDAGFKLANLPDLLVNMRTGKGPTPVPSPELYSHLLMTSFLRLGHEIQRHFHTRWLLQCRTTCERLCNLAQRLGRYNT